MAAEPAMLDGGTPSRLMAVARSSVADLRGGDPYGLTVSLDSTLQNDLGLDSLARVELLHRVEEAFEVRLPEDTFTSAATLRDLLAAVQHAGPGSISADRSAKDGLPPALSPQSAPDSATTLIEVLRWQVERNPSATAIVVMSADGEECITRAALRQGSLALCGAAANGAHPLWGSAGARCRAR
jgi:acyl carrier protein